MYDNGGGMTQTSLKMSKQVKKDSRGDPQALKSTGIHSGTSCNLRRLQALLAKSSPKQEQVLGQSKAGGSRFHSPHPPKDSYGEASELEKFSMTYGELICFNSHPFQKAFANILTLLVNNRLCSDWMELAPLDWALRVLLCLRLLIRDPHYQKMFHCLQGVQSLARYMKYVADVYFKCGQPGLAAQSLVTMTYVFQKLSAVDDQRVWVIESGVPRTLAKLLSTTDSSVLLGALTTLTTLAESPECRAEIGEIPIVENLVVILQDYDPSLKWMAAELLRVLSAVPRIRDELRDAEAVPLLLSLLHAPHLKLLWSVAWVLVQLCQDARARAEVRSWGGVHTLLRLLGSDRQFVCDRLPIENLSSGNANSHVHREHTREEVGPCEVAGKAMALQSACCTALTELSLEDSCAHHIVQENGIYILAKLILPQKSGPNASSLQRYAFRALRFLFSVERNRHRFKRLFPTDLYESFIDVGHYMRDLEAYEGLQIKVSQYSEEELESLRESIMAADHNRPALRLINGYAVLDHLGTGAFGSVLKVQKQRSGNMVALKEVNLRNPVFGKDKKSRDGNVEKIIAELTIIKEQMAHPNIVKYYKTFVHDDKLYIVMELIEGVPLLERCNSLKEKKQRFTEEQIWKIFIQMCLALRYLHKDKRIVHRDLTPNNIMLGDEEKVTITDFGLAKQKQENSKLTSVVGTILYSCPEVVKNEPYGEKADIWALGCIVYQMATLEPPFYSNNMLSLANKIVEAIYEPLEDGIYSERLEDMITWCLSPDPERRPDIVAIGSRIANLMMRHMDALYASHFALEKRAERDRKRAQRYFLEGRRSGKSCCRSFPTQKQAFSTPELVHFPPSNMEENLSLDDASDREEAENKDEQGRHYRSKSAACDTPHLPPCGEDLATLRVKAKSGICVSLRNLRQIEDPVHRLLVQLHKVLYITQLPPASRHNVKRRLVERFKKSLFQFGSDPHNLKTELSKLVQASCDLMESGSSSPDWWPMVLPSTGDADEDSGDILREGVTYEQMQAVVEELLDESGYYRDEIGRCASPWRRVAFCVGSE
ncbi:serine/threonine-protein kinase Nek10 isoform X1 [Hippocampus zosterae]|uniref:serine/threonine-protein kinase Nek10 isoform X1 n=2 Tax=Hippocampus zosterae TaxID=109293 RepID=UPI00223DECB5|nr:serine/threonine-protein kinase Nek10 isoform X1 [Hippocampus zosterae]